MSLLDRIKQLCKEHGITQRKLEQEIGISNGASSKWEVSSPSIEVMKKLSSYFNVSIDRLMTDKPDSDIMIPDTKDEKDIARRLENTLSALEAQ